MYIVSISQQCVKEKEVEYFPPFSAMVCAETCRDVFLFGVQSDLQKQRSEMAVVRGKLRDLKHSQVRARRYFQEYEQGLRQKMQRLDTGEEKVCMCT